VDCGFPWVYSIILGAEAGIRGSEDDLFLPVWANQEHDSKVAPEVGTVSDRRQDSRSGLIRKTADLIELLDKLLVVAPVDFAVVLFRPAGSVLQRSGVQVPQICVRAETGDKIASEVGQGVEDLLLRTEAVSDPVGHPQIGDWSYKSTMRIKG